MKKVITLAAVISGALLFSGSAFAVSLPKPLMPNLSAKGVDGKASRPPRPNGVVLSERM